MKTYDAGIEREELATIYAKWMAAGFIDSTQAESWERRCTILAHKTGLPRKQILEDIKADAELID